MEVSGRQELKMQRCPSRPRLPGAAFAARRGSRAFTLIEVMIAGFILFSCLFAILALVANSLRNARALQRPQVDASVLAAELSLTNKLEEGTQYGDFGDLYPDYRWTRQIQEVSTNGLFQVDFVVQRRSGDRGVQSQMSILLFRPASQRRGFGR